MKAAAERGGCVVCERVCRHLIKMMSPPKPELSVGGVAGDLAAVGIL